MFREVCLKRFGVFGAFFLPRCRVLELEVFWARPSLSQLEGLLTRQVSFAEDGLGLGYPSLLEQAILFTFECSPLLRSPKTLRRTCQYPWTRRVHTGELSESRVRVRDTWIRFRRLAFLGTEMHSRIHSVPTQRRRPRACRPAGLPACQLEVVPSYPAKMAPPRRRRPSEGTLLARQVPARARA